MVQLVHHYSCVVFEFRNRWSLHSRHVIDQSNLVSAEGGALAPDGEGGGHHFRKADVWFPGLVLSSGHADSLVADVSGGADGELHFNVIHQLFQVVSLLSFSLQQIKLDHSSRIASEVLLLGVEPVDGGVLSTEVAWEFVLGRYFSNQSLTVNKVAWVEGTQSKASVLGLVFKVASSDTNFTIAIVVVSGPKGWVFAYFISLSLNLS
jgi:hypothetical protein